MIALGIFLISAAVLTVLILLVTSKDGEEVTYIYAGIAIGMAITLLFIGGIAVLNEEYYPSITPMDVYQGKTTLKYEVVDGVKVDSTVVWKKE